MNLVAVVVIVTFGLFLIGLTGVVFIRPAVAERFFMAFASSAKTHYTEQTIRLIIGASLVVLSPTMWQPNLFRIIGWSIIIPSIVLILTPWQWHHRFGTHVLPKVIRFLKLFAIGLLLFGVLLLYGVFGRSG
jgi:hypothetical protein